MPKFLTTVSLAAALALSAPAFAQENNVDVETTPAAPAQDENGLSIGEEVSQEPQVGQVYVAEVVGDWQMQCLKTEEGPKDCQMYQLLLEDNGNPVTEVSIFRLPPGGQAVAGATVIVPLETLLTKQLTISVDGGPAKRYPYSFCTPIGCYARVGLTQADVDAFKRGAKAVLTLYPFNAPDTPVNTNMSLTGFTAGFDKADVINPAQ